jgi:hypothetical protein
MRCFEKDGAPSIDKDKIFLLEDPVNSDGSEFSAIGLLLTHHFLTALLWHVAGNGLKSLHDSIIPWDYSAVDRLNTGHAAGGLHPGSYN